MAFCCTYRSVSCTVVIIKEASFYRGGNKYRQSDPDSVQIVREFGTLIPEWDVSNKSSGLMELYRRIIRVSGDGRHQENRSSRHNRTHSYMSS